MIFSTVVGTSISALGYEQPNLATSFGDRSASHFSHLGCKHPFRRLDID